MEESVHPLGPQLTLPAPEGSQRASDHRREEILDAAARLVCQRGIERVHTNLVARHLGIGVGTLYGHFRDKTALLAALAEAVEEDQERASRTAPTRGAAGALGSAARLRAEIESRLAAAEARPERFRAAWLAAPQLRGEDFHPGGRLDPPRRLERRLRGLAVQGRLPDLPDPGLAARAHLLAERGLVAWWLEDPARAERRALVDTLVRLHPARS